MAGYWWCPACENEVERLRAENERLRNAAIYASLVLDKLATEDALIASDTLKAALAAGGE